MTAEEALGTFFLVSALGAKTGPSDFLATAYPQRSQVITFAIIGFHRDRGAWPKDAVELREYAATSPANPPLPEDALTGLELKQKEDGSLVYTTLEDRQRGREFTISAAHRVTFRVPSYPFATQGSAPAPVSRTTTVSFDWTDVIAAAILNAFTIRK